MNSGYCLWCSEERKVILGVGVICDEGKTIVDYLKKYKRKSI